ncbi:hypothetical protein IG631_08675 [Alternaria alternata]|nr:hypothetical protein IG631_08675 [Alternaria alternata]
MPISLTISKPVWQYIKMRCRDTLALDAVISLCFSGSKSTKEIVLLWARPWVLWRSMRRCSDLVLRCAARVGLGDPKVSAAEDIVGDDKL